MNIKLFYKICNYLADNDYHKEDLQHFYYELKDEILDNKLPNTPVEIFIYKTLDNLQHVIRHELIKF